MLTNAATLIVVNVKVSYAEAMNWTWLISLVYGVIVLVICQLLELSGPQTLAVYAASFIVLWAAQQFLERQKTAKRLAHEAAQRAQLSVTELNILHNYKEQSQ